MNFINLLNDRIQKFVGVNLSFDEDFSFLEPSGNDHCVQFCFRLIPDEYSDLEHYDQQHFFLLDILEKTGVEFQLDGDGQFATYVATNNRGIKTIRAIMDLRNDFFVVIYYFGLARHCQKFNSKLLTSNKLTACYLNPVSLLYVSKSLSSIRSLQYHFEQSQQIFNDPVMMKGTLKGEVADKSCESLSEQFHKCFNIIQLSGHTTDGSQGVLTVDSTARLQIDACRLSSFLKIVEVVYEILNEKYQFIMEKHIIDWNGDKNKNFAALCSSPLQIDLPYSIDYIEHLAKTLTNGKKPLQMIGLYERVSPKLWKLMVTDTETVNQVQLELSKTQLLIFLSSKNALPVLDKIESYFRNNVAANFASLALN